MQNPENGFSPWLVEQQIEHPATLLQHGEAHLIHHLQSMYDQDNSAAINRVWTRLARQRPQTQALAQERQSPESIAPVKHRTAHPIQRKREPRQANAFVRHLSLLVAVLVVTLLVASLTLVFSLSRGGTITDMPPASGWGKVVYAQTMPDFGFNGLAWSPDSQRVAASNRATATNIVRIWDATTGQHLVTVPIHDFVATIAWSPDSQQVAILTPQSIIIADGRTGHVIRTFTVPSQSSAFISTGVALLSSRVPTSGGPGFRAITWSPDGSQIAASYYFGGSTGSSVLLWKLQTGALVRLPVKGNPIEGISWSSDGKYIAADTFQQTGAAASPSECRVVVWNVVTQQMVLQKDTGSLPGVNVVVAWQPGTQNLAQIGVVKAGSGYTTAILIFNGTTGKTLKKLVVPVSDVLTWSPDGKYLAYTSPIDYTSPITMKKGNTAQILDASNWSAVYTYKNDNHIINELAWSPNGHYIATGETVVGNNGIVGVVRVWTTLD